MDGEEETLLERALAIEDEFCKFDPMEPPTNGHEYLVTVRNEARNCPAVIAAHVNRKKLKQQTFYVPENAKPKISNSFLPSEEWQRWQCEEFDRVRTEVSNMRYALQFQKTPDFEVPEDDADEDLWFQYCFDCSQEKHPLLTHVLVLKQSSLNELLGFFCNWLQDAKIFFSRNTCLWIYALLSCLEIPLLPDTCSTLRRISFEAVNVRSKMEDVNDELLIRLNLIICIVGKYFRQIDLADN